MRQRRQDGYSIVELLVAVTVFALVFAAVSIGIGRALELNRGNRNRSAAAYVAARQLEEVRARSFTSVALGTSTCAYTTTSCNLPSPYTVTQNVVWASPGSTSTSCDVPTTSGAGLAYKRVTVTVTWPDMGGVAPVSSQTLLTPPAGTYDPDDGHILVQAYDRDALPLAGQTVTLSGPETATQTTTSDGCAFFAYLSPGTYTATMSTTGYVDRQGGQPTSQSVGVTASQITRVQFDYDRAATLSVGLGAPSGAVIPTGTYGISMTVANSNLTVGYKSYRQSVTGSGTTRTIAPLFPYASGYQVWAGVCADADPAFYSGGSRGAVLASNQGATTTGSAALDAVNVIVRKTTTTGALINGATVSASHGVATGCTVGETLSMSSTTTSGQLLLALPYGTWTISATSGGRTGTASVTLDPVATAVPGPDRGGPVTARPRDPGQAGITMVEMAVVVALLGLVLTMAFQGVVSYQRAAAGADTRQQNLDQARTVMAVLTKDLRTATEFSAKSATDVTFTGLLNTAATAPANQLRLYVDTNGVLREAVTTPDDPNASPLTYTGTPTTRAVGQGLVSTSGLLSFRDGSDAVTTSLTALTSVVVTVSVDLPSRSGADVPATVLTSRVFLPNVAASASEA